MPDREPTAEERQRTIAEAEKERALAAKYTAETRHAIAEADEQEAKAAIARIDLAVKQRNEQDALAANKHHHFYPFNEAVTAASVKTCIDQLTLWDRTAPDCAIEICFNSPGGEILNGMALFDFIQGLRKRGHQVTTSAIGCAASMAGVLLQAGDTRVMGRESYLLIHEAAFGTGGKIGDVEDTLKFVQLMQRRILDIFAKRAKISKAAIERRWRRKDWWLDSTEAKKFGFVDEVR
jgi:ATP-dependent Clp endopeptidase proteolytic subunit ClpP